MEIACGDDKVFVREYGRVVCGAVYLRFNHTFDISDGVFRCSMDLRHAAERIRVLHMYLLLLYDLAAFKKLPYACGRLDLPLMCTDLMNLRIERLYTAVVCLKGHGSYLVRPIRQLLGLQERPHCMCAHELCAVEQSQTFLGFQLYRFPTHFLPHFRSLTDLAFICHLSQSYQRKAHVGQRSKVSGSSQ